MSTRRTYFMTLVMIIKAALPISILFGASITILTYSSAGQHPRLNPVLVCSYVYVGDLKICKYFTQQLKKKKSMFATNHCNIPKEKSSSDIDP